MPQDSIDPPHPAGTTPAGSATGPSPEEQAPVPLDEPRDGMPPLLTTGAQIAAYAEDLAAGTGPLAVDTERASGFRYSDRAYLVQLRRKGAGTALIDPTATGPLDVLADAVNPLEWILHSADQDLPCLRELGLQPAALFDTELAGRLLDEPKVNLAAMIRREFGLGLAKGHGGSDWSQRPLPREWLVYAALDVELLIELRDALAARLAQAGKSEWARQEFEHERLSPAPPPRADRWRRTSGIHRIHGRRRLAAVRSLWHARDEIARSIDRAPGRVLPDSAIIDAATADPADAHELRKLKVFGGRRQRLRSDHWLEALADARALPDDQLPPRNPPSGIPAPGRWQRTAPEAAERLSAARGALHDLAERSSVPPENILAPRVVKQLCWDGLPVPASGAAGPGGTPDPAKVSLPQYLDDYLQRHGARDWQRGLAVPELAAALASVPSAPVG